MFSIAITFIPKKYIVTKNVSKEKLIIIIKIIIKLS